MIRPWLLSTSLQWRNGPVALRYAYELHHDYFGMAKRRPPFFEDHLLGALAYGGGLIG